MPLASVAQTPTCAVLDSVVRTMERISYYTIGTDRSALKDSLATLCANADTLIDLAPAFTHVLNALGDHHGRIYLDNQPIAWLTDGTRSHRKDDRTPDMDFWQKVLDGQYGFEATLFDTTTGYLRIPAVNTTDVDREARRIRAGLDSLIGAGAKRWIIDLRVNSGGNMWPMLEALAPLFPEGPSAGSLDRLGRRSAEYAFRAGHFQRNRHSMIELPVGKDRSKDALIVLYGRYTASSGEAVAACLEQRPNTTSMGEATAGYTTENGWTVLYDQLVVSIAESVLCTGDGGPYVTNIAPDIVVPDLAPRFDPSDAALNAARAYLQMHR